MIRPETAVGAVPGFLLILALATGCATPGAPVGVEAEIRAVVESCLRAGFVDNDYDRYIAAWSPKSKITFGRSAAANSFDITFPFEQFSKSRKLRMMGAKRSNVAVEFSDSKVSESGFDTVLQHRVSVVLPDWTEVIEERYHLRRGPDGWRILENRWWPIRMGPPDRTVAFVPRFWRVCDALVSQRRVAQDTQGLIEVLMQSFRFPEALRTAQRWCVREPSNVGAWVARGHAASLVGETEDALRAFRQARDLDPKVPVPPFVDAVK